MSAASSQGSADSTTDSTKPDSTTSSSANPTPTGETSSEPGGPECPSTTTWEAFQARNIDSEANGVRSVKSYPYAPALMAGMSMQDLDNMTPLIFSAEASPAKTSPSPDDAPGSQETAADSSSSSPGSLSLFDPTGYSSRTFPVSSLATAVGTSESCLPRWPTSGTAWLGGLSTHVSSECRSADGVCSSSEPSLTEILEPPENVPARYSLSAKAATGILRRAAKRGRALPDHLQRALEAVGMTSSPMSPPSADSETADQMTMTPSKDA